MNHVTTDTNSTQKVKQIPTLIYSRVSGYYNPVQNFNRAKQEEFKERRYINIEEFKK